MQYRGMCNQSYTSPILMVGFSNLLWTLVPTLFATSIGFLNYLLLYLTTHSKDGLENNCRKIEILQPDIWQQMISEINQPSTP